MALERADGSHWRLSGTKQVQALMRTRFVPEQRRGKGSFILFFPVSNSLLNGCGDLKGPQEPLFPFHRRENLASVRCEVVIWKFRPSTQGHRAQQAEQGPDCGLSGAFLCK